MTGWGFGDSNSYIGRVSAISLIKALDLFADLDEHDLQLLVDASHNRTLSRGDVLFSEGDVANCLYVVDRGRIAISNKSVDGRESVFALMHHGDLFGEMSLFDNLGRSAQARALELSVVVEVSYTALQQLWTDRPELLWRVIEMLTRRLRSMDEALADSFFLDVTARTAKQLLEIAGERDEFELPITQEELAGIVGASRERVNKAIASFVRLGWLEQRDRTYRIVKRRELEIRSS